MRNSCCEDGQADADGRTDGEDGGVMHPAFISSIFPSLLFSVSLFGTRKEGRKEGRKERREGRSSGRGNKEVLSRLRLWWRRSVGGDVGKSGGGLTNDRLNDLPFTVRWFVLPTPSRDIIVYRPNSTREATATVRFVSSFIF